ncbi:MAG: two-component system sensor histidine kinase/response regulator, hybrid [Acidobacteriaceae bacterium]|jgi:DNA-binding response OmpR family regulator|nr:two-component system sensor histidine kinase/response regulator, hybrid [Acidobacteriaceae bacterium]
MKRVLVIDDDEALRKLVRIRLSDTYEVVDTGDPEQALALALEFEPDAILLDLMMPQFNGFELCQSFQSLSYTSRIPIFVISGGGEARSKYEAHCEELGAKAYLDKPIDFAKLKSKLAVELQQSLPKRRRAIRLRMRVPLKLKGQTSDGGVFEELTTTEDVSTEGFFCSCTIALMKDDLVDVFVMHGSAVYAGRASVVRKETGSIAGQRYGFQFKETTSEWVLNENKLAQKSDDPTSLG